MDEPQVRQRRPEKALAVLPAGGGGPDGLVAKVVDVIQVELPRVAPAYARGMAVARPRCGAASCYQDGDHTPQLLVTIPGRVTAAIVFAK